MFPVYSEEVWLQHSRVRDRLLRCSCVVIGSLAVCVSETWDEIEKECARFLLISEVFPKPQIPQGSAGCLSFEVAKSRPR